MTFTTFIAKLNWRQIVIHAVDIYLLMYAFTTLTCLKSAALIDELYSSEKILPKKNFSTHDWKVFITWSYYGAAIGAFVGFIIGVFISIKHKWFWVNTLIAYVVIYALYRFNLTGWAYLRIIFLPLSYLFSSTTVKLLVNGSLLLAVGLLCFFSKYSITFINSGNKNHKGL